MKLNPSKFSFRTAVEKFLGYVATKRGIKFHPDYVRVINNLGQSQEKRDIHKLMGRLVVLNKFILVLFERFRLFFRLLKKNTPLEWGKSCQEALEIIKQQLAISPVLSKALDDKKLLLYLSVLALAVSVVLTRVEGRRQAPMYYVSKVLIPPEEMYSTMKK